MFLDAGRVEAEEDVFVNDGNVFACSPHRGQTDEALKRHRFLGPKAFSEDISNSYSFPTSLLIRFSIKLRRCEFQVLAPPLRSLWAG